MPPSSQRLKLGCFEMERESGYYWVRFHRVERWQDQWQIGEWSAGNRQWDFSWSIERYTDKGLREIAEIDENRITRP